VTVDGKPVIDTWEVPLNGPHRGELVLEAGRLYTVCVEYRKTRFFSGMQFGWQYTDGGAAETAKCVALARRADVAIVTAGWDNVSEAEGFDRDFAMNPEIENLLLEVAKVQPNTVVVLTAGGNLDMSRWIDRVRAVLHAFYPGQAGGQALAEIIFGTVNPSGKLPATFEARAEDRGSFACYFDPDNDGRIELLDGIFSGYRYFDREGIAPRFAFGHGLSYTTFRFSDLHLSSNQIAAGDALELAVRVTNAGARAGAEVVQVYVRDVASRLPRPPKELKGFARIELDAGQSGEARVTLPPQAFEYYDPSMHRWVLEPGEFEILVAASAADVRLRATVKVG
jgi:beta-glucosidase